MEKFEKIGKQWEELSHKLRDECINYIKRVCKDKFPDGMNFMECNDFVACFYKCGELFDLDVVYGLWYDADEDKILLDFEYESGYELDYVSTSEVYAVADFIKNHIDQMLNNC